MISGIDQIVQPHQLFHVGAVTAADHSHGTTGGQRRDDGPHALRKRGQGRPFGNMSERPVIVEKDRQFFIPQTFVDLRLPCQGRGQAARAAWRRFRCLLRCLFWCFLCGLRHGVSVIRISFAGSWDATCPERACVGPCPGTDSPATPGSSNASP